MNEVTNIMTVQITMIANFDDADVKEAIEKNRNTEDVRKAEESLKRFLNADDVKIISNQFFVNEKGGSNG